MKIYIATKNKNKCKEFQRILEPMGFTVVTENDLGRELPDVEETGETFAENARLKSRSGCEESGMPCIADDSGLQVDALGGAPGVYSARFAGEHGNDAKNNELLLQKLADVPEDKRTARFVSTVCCTYPNGEEILVTGVCEGRIGYAPKGEGGFGYDPLFMVGGKSFAEMTAEEKDKISHRGNALRALARELAERNKNHDQ